MGSVSALSGPISCHNKRPSHILPLKSQFRTIQPPIFFYNVPMVCVVFSSYFFGNANNINFKYLFRTHQVCLETPKSCFALLKVSTEKRRATAGTKFPARAKEPKTLKRGKLDRSRKGHLLPLLNAYYRWATYKVQFNFFSSNKARVHLHTL